MTIQSKGRQREGWGGGEDPTECKELKYILTLRFAVAGGKRDSRDWSELFEDKSKDQDFNAFFGEGGLAPHLSTRAAL